MSERKTKASSGGERGDCRDGASPEGRSTPPSTDLRAEPDRRRLALVGGPSQSTVILADPPFAHSERNVPWPDFPSCSEWLSDVVADAYTNSAPLPWHELTNAGDTTLRYLIIERKYEPVPSDTAAK
jgi:hypothetical protein